MYLRRLFHILWLATAVTAKWIVPGARWHDTDGNIFNAHAGGLAIDQETGRFYWFGEYKVEGQVEGGGVSVYSSDDLATWTSHGLALAPVEDHPYVSSHNRIQRPKVIYSKETAQYHMWWHVDDSKYSLLLQGLATSDSIAGPYTFQKAISPLGNWSQDFGAFTDYKTGDSYALYPNGDRPEGRDVYVSKFNRNLTDVEKVTFRFDKYDFEAPTILQTEKRPWSQPCFVAPAYTRTFSTQSGFSWRIKGSKATTYLYMADQWDMLSLSESRNVWLPIEIDEKSGSLKVVWRDVYDLDVKTGVWKPVRGKTYASKYAMTSGSAHLQEAKFGSHNVIATGIYGNDSTMTFEVEGQGRDQWVSFYHQNIDDMGFGDQPFGHPDRINGTWQLRRISSVVVNGDNSSVHTLYQKDTHKGIILSTPLLLPLQRGKNTITVGGRCNDFDYKGADLDRITVYPPEETWQKRSFLDALNVWQ
ncbi:hypothetical protein K4K59_000333 [Colletotrichum sp. SAR11_240]|nr:hypothetical protein K4K59_000333 [Colletotrichum sp. SAR11_240]